MGKEAGFIKGLIVLVVLFLIVFFGYFAVKAFWSNKNDLSSEGIRGFINNSVENTKQSAEDAKNQAIDSVKQSAADKLKGAVDSSLGTSTK